MTYSKGRRIIDNAPEEMKDKLRKGNLKIEKAYRQLQKQQKRQEFRKCCCIDFSISYRQFWSQDQETLMKSQKNLFLIIQSIR